MNKTLLVIVAMLFLASVGCAQNFDEIMEDFSLQLQLPSDKVPEDLQVTVYFVYGSHLDSTERAIFDSLKNSPSIRSYATFVQENKTIEKNITVTKRFLQDNETTLKELKDKTNMVVLVGARTHNNLTEEAYAKGYIKNETTKYAGQLVVGDGKLDEDTKIVVLRHNIMGEGNRLEREAVKYSPLQGLIANEYIPIAAASIGMLLMSFLPVLQSVVESKIAEKGKKKAKISEAKHFLGIKPREAIEVLIAAFVLGFALTWTFAGPSADFGSLLLLNSGVCLLAALSHDLTHRIMGKLTGIKMEYKLWYMGSFLTLLTAFLGNSFGLQGFVIEKVEKGTKEWKIGLAKLAAPLVSVSITAAFIYMYSKNPQVVFQMIFTSASIIALAEITPVKGSDGEDIKRWNKYVFYAAFTIISVTYTIVNFIL